MKEYLGVLLSEIFKLHFDVFNNTKPIVENDLLGNVAFIKDNVAFAYYTLLSQYLILSYYSLQTCQNH